MTRASEDEALIRAIATEVVARRTQVDAAMELLNDHVWLLGMALRSEPLRWGETLTRADAVELIRLAAVAATRGDDATWDKFRATEAQWWGASTA